MLCRYPAGDDSCSSLFVRLSGHNLPRNHIRYSQYTIYIPSNASKQLLFISINKKHPIISLLLADDWLAVVAGHVIEAGRALDNDGEAVLVT